MKPAAPMPASDADPGRSGLQPLLDLDAAPRPEPRELDMRRRALSNNYMQDASSGHLSRLSQADAAFDAGYLAVLVVLGPKVPIGHPHPDPLLIQSAAAKLNLPGGASDEALAFLSRQYDIDYRQSLDPTALLSWARLIRAAAGLTEMCGGTP